MAILEVGIELMTILNGEHEPIVDECHGCERVTPDGKCRIYLEPFYHWRSGPCQAATHLHKPEPTVKEKKRVGQKHQVKTARLSRKQQQTYSRVKVPE